MLSTMSMCLSRSSQADGLGARKPELSFPTSENDNRLAAGLASIDAMCLTDLVEPKRCGKLCLVPAATPSVRLCCPRSATENRNFRMRSWSHRVMRSSRTTPDIPFVICRRWLHAATQVHLAVIDAKCRDRDHQTTDL